MRARDRIGTKHDLEPGSFHALTNNVVIEGQHTFHRGKTFFSVTGRTEKSAFVGEIILDHETGLRIEVGAVLSHQFQRIVVRQRAVFDLCATGVGCRSHGIFISMDQRPQPNLPGFIASRVQLVLRKSHRAASTNALGREDFDEIGAGFLLLPYERANFIGRARLRSSST